MDSLLDPAEKTAEPQEEITRRLSITLGDPERDTTLSDLSLIATGVAKVEIHSSALRRAAASEAMIGRLVAERRTIYGVTTGYGPLADNRIDPASGSLLQRRLVYHLATGLGAPFAPVEARAIVVARLITLAQGLSAVRPDLLLWLRDCLNAGLAPIIPEKGTVGASGDLTPLAHMTLAFMGEGQFWRDGKPAPAAAVLADAFLQPITLHHKEGLALVNGTSAMAGIAAMNGVRARRLIRMSALLTIAYAECLGGHRAAWHPLSAVARPHRGQRRACALLWALTDDADRLIPFAPLPDPIPDTIDATGVAHGQPLPQDAYTIRCAPQSLGAIDDMLIHHDDIVATELSSVTDNPLVFADQETILHAGNFFGQHVSFASDSLSNAVTMLGVWAERQVARLTDASLNRELPPFLQGNATGLNSGFMGAQVSASALVGELRAKSAPASIQSVPTNGNNQDVVTMGTIAARRAGDATADVARILSIQALCVAQAIDLRGAGDPRPFSAASRAVHHFIRSLSPFLQDDRPLSAEIENVAGWIIDGRAEAAIRACDNVAEALNRF